MRVCYRRATFTNKQAAWTSEFPPRRRSRQNASNPRIIPVFLAIVFVAASIAEGGTTMKTSTADVATKSLGRVEPLFTAVLQYRSDSPESAVVPKDGHDGALIGSGDGEASGDRVRGSVRWSLWSGNCVYPLIRKGQKIPDGLHLCTMNPAGFIETPDGVRIRFEGRGYGLRTPEKYHTSLTLVFGTEDARYAWLTKVLGAMEGEFDEKAGRAVWNVFIPSDGS